MTQRKGNSKYFWRSFSVKNKVFLKNIWLAIVAPEVLISLLVVAIAGILFLILVFIAGKQFHFSVNDLIASFEGLLLSLVVVGVFGQFLTSLNERRRTIQRYREEIEDYLGWEADEAKFRILGNIRRLNRDGVSDIYLRQAYLPEANLEYANLQGADLWKANMRGVDLHYADLRGAYMGNTILQGAVLRNATLQGANLEYANLQGAWFRDTNLQGVDLMGANLQGVTGITIADLEKQVKSLEGTIMPDGTVHS